MSLLTSCFAPRSIYKKSRSGSELQEVEVTSQQVEVSDIH
jgi:hypothetical protein